MNRVELMPLVTTYQGTGNLGICSVDCCKASRCQDLWLIPIFPKSAESGCGMWVPTELIRLLAPPHDALEGGSGIHKRETGASCSELGGGCRTGVGASSGSAGQT